MTKDRGLDVLTCQFIDERCYMEQAEPVESLVGLFIIDLDCHDAEDASPKVRTVGAATARAARARVCHLCV